MRDDSASCDIGPAESETLCMRGSSMFENREIPTAPVGRPRKPATGRTGKACGRNPGVDAAGKSDTSVVPENAGNKVPASGEASYGGTVNPPRNRKSGAGNPPPAAGRVERTEGLRTGGREGW